MADPHAHFPCNDSSVQYQWDGEVLVVSHNFCCKGYVVSMLSPHPSIAHTPFTTKKRDTDDSIDRTSQPTAASLAQQSATMFMGAGSARLRSMMSR